MSHRYAALQLPFVVLQQQQCSVEAHDCRVVGKIVTTSVLRLDSALSRLSGFVEADPLAVRPRRINK